MDNQNNQIENNPASNLPSGNGQSYSNQKLFWIGGIIALVILIIVGGVFYFSPSKKAGQESKKATQDSRDNQGNNQVQTEVKKRDKLLEKQISTDASGYQVATTSDKYNLIIISDFKETLTNAQTPVLPYKTVTVNLPKGASVDNVYVTFTQRVDLGKLNIPAYVPATPVMGPDAEPAHYVPSPTGIGIFPQKQYAYNVVDEGDKVSVIIQVYPASFDTNDHETVLYKSINISLTYTTESAGFLNSFYVDNDTYLVRDTIKTYADVENTSADTALFLMEVKLGDSGNNVIQTSKGSLDISASSTDTIEADLVAPKVPGNYTITATVSDEMGKIGSGIKTIKVINGQIKYFEVPKAVTIGKYCTFILRVRNFETETATALVNFQVYKGEHQIAKLPQITVPDIPAGETKEVKTQWYPPADLEPGYYLIQATVNINGSTASSELKRFFVGTREDVTG